MKTARTPAIAVIVAVLLVVLLFDPDPRRGTTDAALSVAATVPSSFSSAAAHSDVWFCAGGTATDDGLADHHVLLINTTDVERVASERIGRETVTYVSNIFKYYIAYKLTEDNLNRRNAAKAAVSK